MTQSEPVALPELPPKRWGFFCTKCMHSCEIPPPGMVKGVPCPRCGYFGFANELDYSNDEMLAYAKAALMNQRTPAVALSDEQIEQLSDVLQSIENWSRAYPTRNFPEPDMQKAHEALQAAGMTIDAVSASNMRHVITNVWKMLEPFSRALLARATERGQA